MDIKQYMQLTQQQRQTHIDKDSDCYGYIITQGKRKGQWSDNYCYARKSLSNFFNIEKIEDRNIHTCHTCKNDSSAPNGFVCINPHHLYFGTKSENEQDKPISTRKAGGLRNITKNVKKSLKENTHNSKNTCTCPVCGKTGQVPAMKRWHFDNCKNKSS